MNVKMKRKLTAFLTAFAMMLCIPGNASMTAYAAETDPTPSAESANGSRVIPSDFSDSYKTGKWYQKLHQVKPSGDYLKDLMAIAQSQLD